MRSRFHRAIAFAVCGLALGAVPTGAAVLDCDDEAAYMAADSAYREALIEHHAARQDARSQLIGGALLATQVQMDSVQASARGDHVPGSGDEVPRQERRDRAFAMLGDAASLAPDDVLVQWLVATLRFGGELHPSAAEAARRVTALDPGNIAGWLVRYQLEADGLDDAGRGALLQHAAAGTRHEVFHATILRLGREAIRSMPPPAPLLACADQVPEASPHDMFALGLGLQFSTLAGMGHSATAPCRQATEPADRSACLGMARTMALHAEEMIGEAVGAALWAELAGQDAAESDAARRAARDIEWRREQHAALMQEVDPVWGLAWELTAPLWADPEYSELDIRHALLTGAGVPLQATDDFVPARERAVESARRLQARRQVGWKERAQLEARYFSELSAHHADADDPRRRLVALLHADLEALTDAATRPDDAVHAQALARAHEVLDVAGDDPVALWVLVERLHATRPSVADAALERLFEVDADNAAAWLFALERRRGATNPAERKAMLARAARASGFRVYAMELMRAVADAVEALPPSAALRAHWREAAPGLPDEAHPWMHGMGFAVAIAVPAPPRECAAAARSDQPSALRSLCRELARVLATASDSETGELLGLRLWRDTADTPEDRAAAEAAWRDHAWRSERWSALNEQAFVQAGEVGQWQLLAPHWQLPGTSETDVIRSVLEAADIPLHAPPGFIPVHDRVRHATRSHPTDAGFAPAPRD